MAWITPIIGGLIKNVNFKKEYLHQNSPKPLVASFEINNKCNQQCSYCYISEREESDENNDNLCLIKKCIDLGIQFITVSGKEPLYDDKSFNCLKTIDLLKKESKKFNYGFNTNGINLKKYLKEISNMDPNWITISADKKDIFQSIEKDVKKLIRIPSFRNRIEISTTMETFNEEEMLNLTKYLREIGIKYHSIVPKITKQGDELMQPDIKFLIDYYVSNSIPGIDVYFVLMKNFINNKILPNFKVEKGYKDLMNQDCYVMAEILNYHLIYHNPTRYFRITHDGYLIRGVNLFDKNYKKVSLGKPTPNSLRELLKLNLTKDGTLGFYQRYFAWLG